MRRPQSALTMGSIAARRFAQVCLAVLLAACSSAPPLPTPTLAPGQTPGQPTSTSPLPTSQRPVGVPTRSGLISAALAAGQIDEVTSLLYRAEAVLGMPGLPDEFAAGYPTRDDGVFTTIARLVRDLPPADQARLEPFVARPTEPASVFFDKPTAAVAGAELAADAHPTASCKTWADSGTLDNRFKVWACADAGEQDAEIDIATVVAMMNAIWEPMTRPVPQGMGPPLPDARGQNVPKELGGDARIDLYLLNLGQVVYRNGPNEIDEDAVAEAQATWVLNPDGTYPKNASGFMLLNRDRLGDEVQFRQDLIHEFFHVLQYAHDVDATHNGYLDHWFIEASATWAETFYDRAHSSIPHSRFPGDFQTSVAGLEVADPDHKYAAYVWPFFMEQEAKESAVFNAWAAIDGVADKDFKGVTAAISDQLPFKDNFRDFAVRNLNVGEVLASANEKYYRQLDPQFFDNFPPTNMQSGWLSAGEPYLSGQGGPPPLGAAYYPFGIEPTAKQVTVSIANMSPTDAVDGDVLLHHIDSAKWEKQRIEGGTLRFCRDEDAWKDVDKFYLIVSDHSPDVPILGFLEASAHKDCEEVLELMGDLTWQYEVTILGPEEVTHTSNGQAHIHVKWNPPYGWETQNDSTFSFDYSISNCVPAGSSWSGRLESSVEPKEPTEDVGITHIQAGPKQDIPINLELVGTWIAGCPPVKDQPPGTTYSAFEFPFCSTGGVTALYDGKDSYVVHCFPGGDTLGPSHKLSGEVSGTLTTTATRTPAP